MSKFKIGDRVCHRDKGIGEIVGDGERGWWSVKFFLGGTFSVHESRLSPEPQAEAVAGPAAVSGRKFKVGDRVLVLAMETSKHKGEIGEIVEYANFGWWSVKFLLGETLSVHESRLRPEPQAEIVVAPAVDVSNIAVGNEYAENKYARELYSLEGKRVKVDVYRVIDAYRVTDPAIQHAIKKLLMPGERGEKSAVQDLEEAAFSIRQAIELAKQKGGA